MYKAQAVSEHFVHEWDESIGEPHIVVCEKGLDQIGEAMSKEDAELIAKEWNESEAQEVIAPERGVTLGLTNPWKDLSPLHSYSPLGKKKRNINRTPPKKKRKKK